MTRRSKSQQEILRLLNRGEAYWASYSCVHGQRIRNAARQLVAEGIAQIVNEERLQAETSYVVIPAAARWNYRAQEIAK